MNSIVKGQPSWPRFCEKIPGRVFWPAVIGLPMAYLLLLAFWQWPPFVAQYLFFLLPCTYLLWRYAFAGGWSTERWALKTVLVLLFSLGLTLINNHVVGPFCESLWPLPPEAKAAIDALFHPTWRFGFVYDVFQIAVVPALAEELLFRGLILTAMLKKMPAWLAVLLNGFVFALYHLNPWQFVGLFLLGCAFAAIYAKTRNLGFAMLAHFVNNLVGVLTWWFFENR